MMFAAITPLLMTGAFAERMRYRSFVIFIVLWELLVYYPVAHWIWGGGWMARLGVQDFAGGIVIHTTAGVGAVVSAVSAYLLYRLLPGTVGFPLKMRLCPA
jgi:Amt family ammonium transporter